MSIHTIVSQMEIKKLLVSIHDSSHIGCVITDEEIEKVRSFATRIVEEAQREIVNSIKHKLYGIRANMPLIGGMRAREMMKKFLAELELCTKLQKMKEI